MEPKESNDLGRVYFEAYYGAGNVQQEEYGEWRNEANAVAAVCRVVLENEVPAMIDAAKAELWEQMKGYIDDVLCPAERLNSAERQAAGANDPQKVIVASGGGVTSVKMNGVEWCPVADRDRLAADLAELKAAVNGPTDTLFLRDREGRIRTYTDAGATAVFASMSDAMLAAYRAAKGASDDE